MNDSRGILRGRCKNCESCHGYSVFDNGLKCSLCDCPPGRHVAVMSIQGQHNGTDLESSSSNNTHTIPVLSSNKAGFKFPKPYQFQIESARPVSLCAFPGCSWPVDFNINTGVEYNVCAAHGCSDAMFCEDVEGACFEMDYQSSDVCTGTSLVPDTFSQDFPLIKDSSMCILPECYKKKYVDSSGQVYDYCGKTHAEEGKSKQILPNSPDQQPVAMVNQGSSSTLTCAIQECSKPCYVDESGKVHPCCGITHAMEQQRRQALWNQVNQQVVKGITHCLLPECSKQTWAFQHYCGRSHADVGIQRRLIPPPPPTSASTNTGPKDNSLCIIPGCQNNKYVDQSTNVTHDYCGKTCAGIGKARGIFATSSKVEEQCDLPGCTNKKKTEAGKTHDYCCRDHAQKDAPNRDARILTSMAEVQKFLKKFPSLKVVKLDENDHAKPGGSLFNKFKKAMMSLPSNQRNTCLAFHGTAEGNIHSICSTGYDQKRRSGQALGPGEYFATSPGTPMSYCKGGRKMLLNELLLGQSGTHHTKHGDVVVMKNPEHDLPRFVVTFQ